MQQMPDNFNLTSFINESKNRLSAILNRLQWSEDYVMQVDRKSTGTKPQYEKYEACDELPLPESCTTTNSVTLDVNELRSVVDAPFVEIPERFSDLQVNFSREQKLRIYEHIVQCTGKCTEPEAADSVAFGEIVAAKKREKKNKRRHRISKPTHIEEVRALVDLQMQSLQQYMHDKREVESKQLRTHRHRSRSRQRGKQQQVRHKSGSRSRSRNQHKSHTRRRSRSRSHESKQHKHKKHRSETRECKQIRHNKSRSRSREKNKRTHKRNRSRSRESKQHKHKRIRSRSRSHDRQHSKKHSQSSQKQ